MDRGLTLSPERSDKQTFAVMHRFHRTPAESMHEQVSRNLRNKDVRRMPSDSSSYQQTGPSSAIGVTVTV